MSELSEAINEMRTMRESYDELVSQSAQLAANVQAIKDAHILSFNYDGVTVYNPQTISFLALSLNLSNIKAIIDDSIGSLAASQSMFNKFPALKELTLNACITMSGDGPFLDNGTITKVSMPSLLQCSAVYAFHRTSALREVYIPKCEDFSGTVAFYNSPEIRIVDISNLITGFGNLNINSLNCIDIRTGKKVQGNFSLGGWGAPTYALLPDSTSLLTPEDIAAGFTSNLEKLLYNIREHIAANLPDRTGLSSFTITFGSAIKAAILADQPTADAFTNKNWTIA